MSTFRAVSAAATAALTAGALAACATATAPEDEGGRPPAADAGDTQGARPDAGDIRPEPADAAVPVGADAAPEPLPDAAPEPGCQPGQALGNGDFDLGPGGGWSETSGAPQDYPLIVTAAELPQNAEGEPAVSPHSGGHAVWLGGYLAEGASASDLLRQTVAVPAGATGLELSGQRILASEEPGGAYDFVRLEILDAGGTVLETVSSWSNEDQELSWAPFAATIAGDYAGQAIGVRLRATVDDLYNTNFFFDSLALTVSCP